MPLQRLITASKNMLHEKLMAPIYDRSYPAEYTARGAFVGLMVALTPTVGMQIPMLMLIWPFVKRWLPRLDFNLVVAIAWTFITNVFTLPFFYYLFIVTGRAMLGRWENINGFDVFESRMAEHSAQSEWYIAIFEDMTRLLSEFGLPLFIGSLPWAIVGSVLGYYWCLRMIEKQRARHPDLALKSDKQ